VTLTVGSAFYGFKLTDEVLDRSQMDPNIRPQDLTNDQIQCLIRELAHCRTLQQAVVPCAKKSKNSFSEELPAT
jgi:hypothetical protein